MGTEARIVLHASDSVIAERAATAAFQRIAAVDAALSDYRVDSEVSALAAQPPGVALPVSRDFVRVLAFALDIARRTDGAFDPTAGPLTLLWREARRTGRLPDRPDLERARKLTDWTAVTLDTIAGTVQLARAGMRLDFGAIAKGHALDEAMAALVARSVPIALLSMGGEILAGDPPPDLPGWPVTITSATAVDTTIHLARLAVSASGDVEQFVDIDGVRYSHVVDPRTGMALTDRTSATVTAPDAMTADVLATALTVLEAGARTRLLAAFPDARARVYQTIR
jgi:thiamine biosynthesis lipoprotein